MIDDKFLCEEAVRAAAAAYAPYSGYKVGAALLCSDGSVYTGCNIENASYSPTVCAERVAFFKAVSDGRTSFSAIAVAGGEGGSISGVFPPCGVCRQVMAEFCDPKEFRVLLVHSGGYEERTLDMLLPDGFSGRYVR